MSIPASIVKEQAPFSPHMGFLFVFLRTLTFTALPQASFYSVESMSFSRPVGFWGRIDSFNASGAASQAGRPTGGLLAWPEASLASKKASMRPRPYRRQQASLMSLPIILTLAACSYTVKA